MINHSFKIRYYKDVKNSGTKLTECPLTKKCPHFKEKGHHIGAGADSHDARDCPYLNKKESSDCPIASKCPYVKVFTHLSAFQKCIFSTLLSRSTPRAIRAKTQVVPSRRAVAPITISIKGTSCG
jgi:hypothetical protein